MTEYLEIDGEMYAEHEWECRHCQQVTLSRYPIGCDVLECSHCGKFSAPVELVSAPLIITIAKMNDCLIYQVNRKVKKEEVWMKLQEAMVIT